MIYSLHDTNIHTRHVDETLFTPDSAGLDDKHGLRLNQDYICAVDLLDAVLALELAKVHILRIRLDHNSRI